eukprot:Phypoly_transcript_08889.p1 GENE.Phypoly_transcript_08889~~Phypoly_transcript_08889.p1  ORF type:complete len:462 (+),score=51.80 Phypoly_transcript_08889:149-1387(+)
MGDSCQNETFQNTSPIQNNPPLNNILPIQNSPTQNALHQNQTQNGTPTSILPCTKMWQPECSLPYNKSWDFDAFAREFECLRDTWCDTYYNKDETIGVQNHLYDLQHPASCDRLLVINGEATWGLGSCMHLKSQIMGIGVAENRGTIIGKPEWVWAQTEICKEDKYSAECWFEPYSSCTNDSIQNSTWNLATNWTEINSSNVSIERIDFWALIKNASIPRVTYVPPIFSHKDSFWWHAQSIKYLARPNARTISVVKEEQKKIFGGDGSLPHPIISLYIRHGDKWKEAKPKSVKAYMDRIMLIADKHNIKHLYVGTDDQLALDELVQNYSSRFQIYFIDTPRLADNQTTPMQMMRTNSEIMRVSLVDLYIQIQGDVFVGTRSSNWCRLIDELRKVNGKARIPYFSPEYVFYDN